MEVFINLVDTNAPSKIYKRLLGLDVADVRVHLRFLTYYRLYKQLHDKVKELQKQKSGVTDFTEKNKIKDKIRELRKEYRPKIERAMNLRYDT